MTDTTWRAETDILNDWDWDHDLRTYTYATDDGMLTPQTLGEQIARGSGDAEAEAAYWAFVESVVASAGLLPAGCESTRTETAPASHPDPVAILDQLGAQWSPDFDAYASGQLDISQVRCVLCTTAPCSCVTCPRHRMSTLSCQCS